MGLYQENQKGVIVLTPDCLLRTRKAYGRIACKVAEFMRREKLTRRKFADWLAETVYAYEGRILWPDGREFSARDTLVDDAFNDDGSCRWVSALLAFAENPPRQRPQRRIVPRLRLIDLALLIAARDRQGAAGTRRD